MGWERIVLASRSLAVRFHLSPGNLPPSIMISPEWRKHPNVWWAAPKHWTLDFLGSLEPTKTQRFECHACRRPKTIPIPHICHFFYTTAIWGVEILHLKVCKFAKVDSRQNSVNYHPRTQIMICVKIMICMLNCESNYTLCKIASLVKDYTMCKIYTQCAFFHVPYGKFYTWLKTFTQPAVVMVVTNMGCVFYLEKPL